MASNGSLAETLRHVQVERYFISRRYRVGAVTIGPELSVDAGERQITADRSLASLPTSLQATTLFEAHGELIEAAGGVLEFSDLLKRPLDAFRYLQLTHRQQALLLATSGAVLVAAMWTILGVEPAVLQTLLQHPRSGMLVWGGCLIGPWIMFYGALRLVIPEVEAPPPGARFGGVLTEARDAGPWKIQLAAIALAIAHTVLYANAF